MKRLFTPLWLLLSLCRTNSFPVMLAVAYFAMDVGVGYGVLGATGRLCEYL